MKTLNKLAIAGAFGAAFAIAGGAAAQDCTADNLDGCIGKPWVDGDTMESPLGSK